MTDRSEKREPEEVLQGVLESANELLDVEQAALQLVDSRDPSQLVTVATRGFEDVPPAALQRMSVNVGVNGEALLRGELVTVDDYQSYPAAQPQVRAAGMKVAMATPLRESGVISGVLLVSSRERRRPFSNSEREAFTRFAERASRAVAHARGLGLASS
jgi:GAF domain-containing protein